MNKMAAIQFRAALNREPTFLHRRDGVGGIRRRNNKVAPIPTKTFTSPRIIAGITRTVSNLTEKLSFGDLRRPFKCSIGQMMTAKKEISVQSALV
jgi:hypothetical protein